VTGDGTDELLALIAVAEAIDDRRWGDVLALLRDQPDAFALLLVDEALRLDGRNLDRRRWRRALRRARWMALR
jgi:hypothetical protein